MCYLLKDLVQCFWEMTVIQNQFRSWLKTLKDFGENTADVAKRIWSLRDQQLVRYSCMDMKQLTEIAETEGVKIQRNKPFLVASLVSHYCPSPNMAIAYCTCTNALCEHAAYLNHVYGRFTSLQVNPLSTRCLGSRRG